jgi:GR25 family glycosyltransferase involved in LPS biosynthesis
MTPFVFNDSNTFCISLETNPQRWERMSERFAHFQMEVTKVWACTREDLKDNFWWSLNDGQKGCAQSHINLWRHIVENNLEYALILEDDACFDKEWVQKLELFSNTIQDADWYAVFLNASEPMIPPYQWTCTIEQYLTAGYIISQAGAKKLLEMYSSCFFSSDWMTTRLQLQGHCYCYFPWLIIQEGKDSNIGSNLDADRTKVQRCLKDIDYSLENYI